MANAETREYRLALGETVIGLHCDPGRIADGLGTWFDRPSSAKPAHIDLTLEVDDRPYDTRLPNSLLTTKKLGGNGAFDVAGGLITGEYDSAKGAGVIRANSILFQMPLIRVLEQIFYQAFHSARQFSREPAFLVHSSAVVSHGAGFLFVGPSEAGKSTAAKCSAEYHVLGDEMNLIVQTADGLIVEGTGFNGTFREKSPGRAPLKAVLLLDKTSEHGLREVPIVEATTTLAAEIVPPVGLDEIPGPRTLPDMVDAAGRVLRNVPVRCLEFRPDPGFWPLIHREFGLETDPGPLT